MVYNLTWMNESATFTDMFTGINQTSEGMIAEFILIAIFIIIMVSFKNYNTKVIFLVDSFFCTLFSVLLFGVGVTGVMPIIFFSFLLIISVFIKVFGGE